MGIDDRYPDDHAAFLERCHAAGQTRPTPLLLRYGPATTTACIRTSTASMCFRCRSAILLSEPGRDFTGGEFVLTEQRPRMQSRAEVVPLRQGDARDLRRAPPAGAGHARSLSRQPAPWRQPPAIRPASYGRRDLPRRNVRCLRYRAIGRGTVDTSAIFRSTIGQNEAGWPAFRPTSRSSKSGNDGFERGNKSMPNKVKDIWKSGKAVVNGWLAIPSGFSAEVIAQCGFDSVTVDIQHGVQDYLSMVPAFRR